MTSLNDLRELDLEQPSSSKEWLSLFTQDEQATIIESIISLDRQQCYDVLSYLDENPYPFDRKALVDYRKRLIKQRSQGLI